MYHGGCSFGPNGSKQLFSRKTLPEVSPNGGSPIGGSPIGGTGLLLRIWLKQGEEKRLLARILKILEEARKRLLRQNSTKK